jgi:hypothetical protein
MYYTILNTCIVTVKIADAELHIFVPNLTYPFVRVLCMYKFKINSKQPYYYSFVGQGHRFNPQACATTIVYTFGYRV